MTKAGRRACLPQETQPCQVITQMFFADDFQCHGAAQIDVECLVSDSHGTATQLDWFPIFPRHQLIVLKSFRYLFQCWIDLFTERRPARFNPGSKPLAKRAYRTEFYRSRKLVTATRAGASLLRFHGPNRTFSRNVSRKQSRAPPQWCESGPHGPWQILVPVHKQLRVSLH